MPPNQVLCPQCGNSFLAKTAATTGGMCVPCASGTRGTLGSVKKRYEEFLERTKIQRAIWSEIVDRVHAVGGGLDSLTPAERTYYLLSGLDGEVWRGGIHTFFNNSSGNHYRETLEALTEVQCPVWIDYLTRAAAILFPNAVPPSNWDERRKIMPWRPKGDDTKPEWEQGLDELEADCKPRLEDLSQIVGNYALAHHIIPSPDRGDSVVSAPCKLG